MLGLDFHLISIFCLHRALFKIRTWKHFGHGNIFAHGKIKIEEIPREKKKKKVSAMGYFSLDPSSLTTGGPVVLLVCGFTRQDNLRAWRELSANLYELKSHV